MDVLPIGGAMPDAHGQGELARAKVQPAQGKQRGAPVTKSGVGRSQGQAGRRERRGQTRVADMAGGSVREGCGSNRVEYQVERAEWDQRLGTTMPDNKFLEMGFQTLSSLGMNPQGF